MTHPAIDDTAAARLRPNRPTEEPKTTGLKASARKAAGPMIARLRQELDRAGAEDLAALRAEVAALREEVARLKAEHAADLAALHEELASTRPPKAKPST